MLKVNYLSTLDPDCVGIPFVLFYETLQKIVYLGLASPSFDIWCFWGKITRPAEIKLLNFLSLKHNKNEYPKLKSIPKTDFHNFSKNIITLFKEKILAKMELMIWDILQAGSISILTE